VGKVNVGDIRNPYLIQCCRKLCLDKVRVSSEPVVRVCRYFIRPWLFALKLHFLHPVAQFLVIDTVFSRLSCFVYTPVSISGKFFDYLLYTRLELCFISFFFQAKVSVCNNMCWVLSSSNSHPFAVLSTNSPCSLINALFFRY